MTTHNHSEAKDNAEMIVEGVEYLPEGLRPAALRSLADLRPKERTLESLLEIRRREMVSDGTQYEEVIWEEIKVIKAAIAEKDEIVHGAMD